MLVNPSGGSTGVGRGLLCLIPLAIYCVCVHVLLLDSVKRLASFEHLDNNYKCCMSNSIHKRKTNFLAKLKCYDSVLIGLFSNVISMKLSAVCN